MVPLALVAALTLGTIWFLQNYEKKPFEEVQGGSPQALRDPLLAAQKYLQVSGKNAIGYRGISLLSTLPPPRGALFIRRMPRGLSKSINDKLFSWVTSGGHLILTPNPWQKEGKKGDDILSRLGVQVQKGSNDCGCPPKPEVSSKHNSAGKKGKKNAAAPVKPTQKKNGYHPHDSIIDVPVDHHHIHLKYFGAALLKDTKDSASFKINGSHRIVYKNIKDKKRKDNNEMKVESGNWLLEYRVGAGKVTVLSENTLFTNRLISDYDHAFFLSWLLKDDHIIRLLYSSESQGFLTLLLVRMPFFWICLAMLIALVLWRMQKKSGGYLQPGKDEHRNILVHIDASGMFAWRVNRATTIIAANRKAILQQWSQKKLSTGSNKDTELLSTANLAKRSGIPEKDVINAFQLRIEGEQDLINTSRALQKIHRRLHGGESKRHDG